ncbi:MAG TPA: hypothetical protein VGB58_03555 [Blastococcus sp.]
MTALTPGCDPDLSVTGAPFGAAAGGGPRVRSGLVLIAVLGLSVLLATADSVPGPVAVPAVVVGVLCALVLVRRGVRVAHRAGSAAAASVARAAHRSRPVPSPTP